MTKKCNDTIDLEEFLKSQMITQLEKELYELCEQKDMMELAHDNIYSSVRVRNQYESLSNRIRKLTREMKELNNDNTE
jgi:predicted RNase H-like nuclease (RuvC/YqgF family)